MQFLKRNIWTILCLALVVVLASFDASAQVTGNTVMSVAQSKLTTTFKSVKTIIFVVGGFGLILVAFMAIFGKLNWKLFAMLAVGLGILAAAGAVVDYATGGSSGSKFGDTFSDTATPAAQ